MNNTWEPPLGASLTTIRPFQNMAVRFPSNLYHQVTEFTPKIQGFEMKRLSLVYCYWDHHPEGYKYHKHSGICLTLHASPHTQKKSTRSTTLLATAGGAETAELTLAKLGETPIALHHLT